MSRKKHKASLFSFTDVNGLLATEACAHSSLLRRVVLRFAALASTSTNLVSTKSRGASSNLKAPTSRAADASLFYILSGIQAYATLNARFLVAGSFRESRNRIV